MRITKKLLSYFNNKYYWFKYGRHDKGIVLIFAISATSAVPKIGSPPSYSDALIFEVSYNKKSKKYYLQIETAFLFETQEEWCRYLREGLKEFTEFMIKERLDINEEYSLFCKDISFAMESKTIEKLYVKYKMFVKGFCALYEIKE